MTTIYTGQCGSRAAVRAAVAAHTPVVWQFDGGYVAMSPNGNTGVTTVAIYDATNAAVVLPQFLTQFPSTIQVLGNAGFSAVWGSFGSSDYADDKAQADAIASSKTRSFAGVPLN